MKNTIIAVDLAKRILLLHWASIAGGVKFGDILTPLKRGAS